MPLKNKKKYKEKNNPIELTPFNQDIIVALSTCISYSEGLASLGQTCKEMHKFVENTPAGQLALQAAKLEPNSINSSLANNYKAICIVFGALMSTCGLMGSLILGVVTDSSVAIMASGIGVGCVSYLIDQGLFKNKENVENIFNQINDIHENLQIPIKNW